VARCGVFSEPAAIEMYHDALKLDDGAWAQLTEHVPGYSDQRPAIQEFGRTGHPHLELKNCANCKSTLGRLCAVYRKR
jgi:hypothetical protein